MEYIKVGNDVSKRCTTLTTKKLMKLAPNRLGYIITETLLAFLISHLFI